MARKSIDLQTELSTLRNELELSTFLNKGVLQSNQEQKLRITELEAENEVLRKAEKKLSTTEDSLEQLHKRCKEIERERGVFLREKKKLEGQVESLCVERDGWKARFEGVKSYWGSVSRGMTDVLDVLPPNLNTKAESSKSRKSLPSSNAIPGPSSTRKTKSRTSIGKDKPVVYDLEDDNAQSSTRKRRKLSTSPLVSEPHSPSMSPPRPTEIPIVSKPRKSNQHASTAKRHSNTRKSSDDLILRLKNEPISPQDERRRKHREDDEDSDDDPLAMMGDPSDPHMASD